LGMTIWLVEHLHIAIAFNVVEMVAARG
jgi:hypothetical protein